MSHHSVPGLASPHWLAPAVNHGILSKLPQPLVAAVLQGAVRSFHAAGTVIPHWDERPWSAVVVSGAVRVFLPSREGEQVTLRYMRAGDIIGSFGAVRTTLPRSLEALDASEFLHLDVERLEALARAEPPLAFELLNESARVVRLAHRAYTLRAFATIRVRVANAILERASARGDIVPGTVVHGTQHDLAVAAGTVREVVASSIQAFKREAIVDVKRGGIVILDPQRLAHEAQANGGFWPLPGLD